MNLRCAKFYIRGMLWLRPVPDHRDLKCWLSGQSVMGTAILGAVVIALLAGGYAAGRYFQ